MCVWEINTGKEVGKLAGHRNQVRTLAFSSDGKTLFSASDRGAQAGPVRVWDVAKGEELKRIPLHGSDERVPPTPLGFSPDGKTLSLADWHQLERKHAKGRTIMRGHSVARLDLETGRIRLKMVPLVGRFKTASLSPDGKLISAMYGSLKARRHAITIRVLANPTFTTFP